MGRDNRRSYRQSIEDGINRADDRTIGVYDGVLDPWSDPLPPGSRWPAAMPVMTTTKPTSCVQQAGDDINRVASFTSGFSRGASGLLEDPPMTNSSVLRRAYLDGYDCGRQAREEAIRAFRTLHKIP